MERLHPRIRVAWALRILLLVALIGALGVVLDRFVVDLPAVAIAAAVGLVLLAGIAHVLLRFRIWRYGLEDDALVIVRGVLTRVNAVVPYVRVQHVDTQRGPLDRLLGLSSVVVYTAGSRGADVTVPGLTPAAADALQDRLRALAVESEPADAV